jgi:hypothetical protein
MLLNAVNPTETNRLLGLMPRPIRGEPVGKIMVDDQL